LAGDYSFLFTVAALLTGFLSIIEASKGISAVSPVDHAVHDPRRLDGNLARLLKATRSSARSSTRSWTSSVLASRPHSWPMMRAE